MCHRDTKAARRGCVWEVEVCELLNCCSLARELCVYCFCSKQMLIVDVPVHTTTATARDASG